MKTTTERLMFFDVCRMLVDDVHDDHDFDNDEEEEERR